MTRANDIIFNGRIKPKKNAEQEATRANLDRSIYIEGKEAAMNGEDVDDSNIYSSKRDRECFVMGYAAGEIGDESV